MRGLMSYLLLISLVCSCLLSKGSAAGEKPQSSVWLKRVQLLHDNLMLEAQNQGSTTEEGSGDEPTSTTTTPTTTTTTTIEPTTTEPPNTTAGGPALVASHAVLLLLSVLAGVVNRLL